MTLRVIPKINLFLLFSTFSILVNQRWLNIGAGLGIGLDLKRWSIWCIVLYKDWHWEHSFRFIYLTVKAIIKVLCVILQIYSNSIESMAADLPVNPTTIFRQLKLKGQFRGHRFCNSLLIILKLADSASAKSQNHVFLTILYIRDQYNI